MKTVVPSDGLCHSGSDEKRWEIRTIYDTAEVGNLLKEALETEMEKMKTVEDLCKYLSRPNIEVTNKKDKDTGFATIRRLDRDIKDASKSKHDSTVEESSPQRRHFSLLHAASPGKVAPA